MPVTFVPHLVPLDRGILETIYARLRARRRRVRYRGGPGGGLRRRRRSCASPARPSPRSSTSSHTNFCDIGWTLDRGQLVMVVSVIDNLVKGAAGQAVQNFNVAFGFDERSVTDGVPRF